LKAIRALVAIVAALGLFATGIVANAATTQTTQSRHQLDPAFCRVLNDGARAFVAANPGSKDPTVTLFRNGLRLATDTNCYSETTMQVVRPQAAAIAKLLGTTTASADGCWHGWPSQNYYWAGLIYVGYTYIGFSGCWVTNQLVTSQWGPDSGGSFIYPYQLTRDWWGYTTGSPANPLTAGLNFHVQACLAYCGPSYWGDQRDSLYNNGTLYQYN